MRSAIVLVISVFHVGCFAVRLPPPIEHSRDAEPSAITLRMISPPLSADDPTKNDYAAEQVAEELRATRLFAKVLQETEDVRESHFDVYIVDWKRVDEESWCYESYAYVGFTLFLIPGCGYSLGYRLEFRSESDSDRFIPFDFEYESFHLAGWVALGFLPFPNWSLPRADSSRRVEYLRDQLAPMIPVLIGLSRAATGRGDSQQKSRDMVYNFS